ncbi:MAG: alpha/beta hydrolase [Armatimonadetes bacterium]|nr:alpha/beta hydrolase [Armatimonadota bacterium]
MAFRCQCILTLALWLLCIAGCAAGEVRMTTVSYGADPEQKLDLFRTSDNPRPLVVLLHGGAWWGGSRQAFHEHARLLASEGFVAATVDYRLAPRHTFPAAVDDVRAAIRWLVKNVKVTEVTVGGHSAGAHLALMVATTPKESPKVQRAFGLAGIYELAGYYTQTQYEFVPAFIGGLPSAAPEKYRAASPTLIAVKETPPVLLWHGARDEGVPTTQSERLADRLRKLGVKTQLRIEKNASHEWFLQNPGVTVAGIIRWITGASAP